MSIKPLFQVASQVCDQLLLLSGDPIVPSTWSTAESQDFGVTRAAQWTFQWRGMTLRQTLWWAGIIPLRNAGEKTLTQVSVSDPTEDYITHNPLLIPQRTTCRLSYLTKAGFEKNSFAIYVLPVSSMASLCSLHNGTNEASGLFQITNLL